MRDVISGEGKIGLHSAYQLTNTAKVLNTVSMLRGALMTKDPCMPYGSLIITITWVLLQQMKGNQPCILELISVSYTLHVYLTLIYLF